MARTGGGESETENFFLDGSIVDPSNHPIVLSPEARSSCRWGDLVTGTPSSCCQSRSSDANLT